VGLRGGGARFHLLARGGSGRGGGTTFHLLTRGGSGKGGGTTFHLLARGGSGKGGGTTFHLLTRGGGVGVRTGSIRDRDRRPYLLPLPFAPEPPVD